MAKTARKVLIVVLGALLALALSLAVAACGPNAGKNTVTLSFETNGGSPVQAITAEPGEEVELPSTEKDGYAFDGWYVSSNWEGEALFGTITAPEKDTKYYAKWMDLTLPAITLELDGGVLANGTTTLHLAAGENLYEYMQNYIPTKAGHEFGVWMVGETELARNATMPEEGITLTAKWKIGYTVEVYTQNLSMGTSIEDYELNEELSATGYDYAGTVLDGRLTLNHFTYNSQLTESVVLSEENKVVKAYYDRDTLYVLFEANAPVDGVSGSMEIIEAPYGQEVTLPKNGFSLSGYRFLGWATTANGAVEFLSGETVTLDQSYVLYALWDGNAYGDALGGMDYVFRSQNEGENLVYLQREGLPEVEGTIDENNYFEFKGNTFTLKGRINEGKKTFTYLLEDMPGEYVQLDAYLGYLNYATVLEIKAYDSASLSFYEVESGDDGIPSVGALVTSINGTYALEDPYWKQYGLLTFTATSAPDEEYAEYASFNFQLGYGTLQSGETVQYFAIQGKEATNGTNGEYYSIDGTSFSFPIMLLDGFGSCVLYMSETEYYTGNCYTPASYWSNQPDAGDDELAICHNDTYYGLMLDFVVRISAETGITSSGTQVTVGVWEWKDSLYGPYDYVRADGLTERYFLSGYGEVTYYGVVTKDAEGNESFEKEVHGTYEMRFANFYNASYSADEGSYYYNLTQYNELQFNFSDSKKRVTITGVPSYDKGWTTGAIVDLDPMAGAYTVENPETLSYNLNGTRYLNPQTLYITCMEKNGATNYVELWGATGLVAGSISLSRIIFAGNLSYKGTQNNHDIYTITVMDTYFATVYPEEFTIDFYFTEEGTIVFLAEEQTFETWDGGVFKIDGFNNATYTAEEGSDPVAATFDTLLLPNGTVLYHFESENAEAIFFLFEDAAHELLLNISESRYQYSDQWNKVNIHDQSFYKGTLYLFADDTALFFVSNTTATGTYYVFGTIAEVESDAEGFDKEYTFTRTSGDTLPQATTYYYGGGSTNSVFTFKLLEDGSFVVRSTYLYFTRNGKTANTKLEADGYGNATYTDAEGNEHTGTIELLFEATGTIRHDTKAFASAYYENFYVLTEANGSTWGFIIERSASGWLTTTNGGTSNLKDNNFIALSGEEYLFGVWWSDDNGSVGNKVYYSNGYILTVWAYNNSSLSTVTTDGVWTHMDDVSPIEETEATYDYTFRLKNRSGTWQNTVYTVGLFTVTANDGETKWNILFQYDASIWLDYDIVDDDDNVIGHLTGNGYYGMTYTDADGKEYDMTVDENDAEGLVIRYRNEDDMIYRLSFDLIKKGDKTVAWQRTEPYFMAWLATRQLRDINVYIKTDGHGSATLWTDAAGGVTLEGAIEQTGDYTYRFVSEEFSMDFELNIDTTGGYYFYLIYAGEYTGVYYDQNTLTTIYLDGYQSAVYYDSFGRRYVGQYNVLGEKKSILEFYSAGSGYVYYNFTYGEDGTPNVIITPVVGAYAYEGNIVLGYQGGKVAPALPAGVDTIGRSAFYGRAITSIDLTGIVTVEEFAFYGCERLETLTGTAGITSIGRYAFYDCRSLTEVDFSNLRTVGEYGLGYLLSLPQLNLPAIEELGDYALYYARSLERIDIGANMKHFGKQAFFNATSLTGHMMDVYLHTTPTTDYNNLVGSNQQVFYQCEINLYVDSIEVVKAIYNSSMATEYRTTGYYEQYWQLLRVANDETDEYGFYLIANFTDYTTKASRIIRLDGQLADGSVGSNGAVGAVDYWFYAYERKGNTLNLAYYDASLENHYGTLTATLTEGGSLLAFSNGITWAKLSETESLVYQNEDGSKFEFFGTADVGISTGAFELKNLTGTLTYADGLSVEGTMTQTNPSGDAAGYLKLTAKIGTASSNSEFRIALNADKSFEVIYENIYYFDAVTGGNSYQLRYDNSKREENIATTIASYSASVEYTDPETGARYSVSGASTAGNRSSEAYNEVEEFDGKVLKFRLNYGTSSIDATIYDVTVKFDHATGTYEAKITVILGNERWTLTTKDGTLIDSDHYESLDVNLVLDKRSGSTEVIGFYMDNSQPRATRIGADADEKLLTKGFIRNDDDGTLTLYVGDNLIHSAYKFVYTPATDSAPASLKAYCVETSVTLTHEGESVVFALEKSTGKVVNVVSITKGGTTYTVAGVIKTADNNFTVVAGSGSDWKQYTVVYNTNDYTLTETDAVLTLGTQLQLPDSYKATFVYDAEGNAVGITEFTFRPNGVSTAIKGTNHYVFAGTKVNEFTVAGINSNKCNIHKVTYVAGEAGAEGTFTYEQVRWNPTYVTEDGMYRIGFTVDKDGKVLGINMVQYKSSATATYFSGVGSADFARSISRRNEDGTWTVYISASIKITVSFDEQTKTLTVTKV